MPIRNYLLRNGQTSASHYSDDMLRDDLESLIRGAEDFLESTASYSGAEIEAARARVVSQLHTARQHIRQHRRAGAYRRASDMAQHSGRYIIDHKWQSISVLAAAAALAGGIYAGLKWTGCRRRTR